MRRLTLLFGSLMFVTLSAFADVKDSGATGFTLVSSFTVKGSPADTFGKIVAVGDWWSSDHTYSGDAHNLSIDARAGGCWCEKLPKSGGSVAHMQVAAAMPGTM